MAGEPETLDTDEPLARRTHRHGFDRLIMLSDGVFAIAITLLAFDLRGPAVWDGSLVRLWSDLAPKLDAYALSFLVISVYWLAHKRFMAMILTVDAAVSVINLVMLALVALLPAATQLVHTYDVRPETMLIYGGLVVAIGATLAVLWAYAALIADLVSPQVPRRVRWFLLVLIVLTPPLFLGLVMLIANPPPGVVPVVLTALFLIGWRMRLWVLTRLER